MWADDGTDESDESSDPDGEHREGEFDPDQSTDNTQSGDDEVVADDVEEDGNVVPDPTDPVVMFDFPMDGETVENPVRFAVGFSDVASLARYADECSLGSIPASGVLEYTFSEVDRPRVIRLVDLDASGIAVAEDFIAITTTNPLMESEGSLGGVPYFYQYDNTHEPSTTCGVTSAPMLLGDLGSDIVPDELYVRYGKEQGQSPEGLAELYRWEGFLSDFGRAGTRSQMKDIIDEGYAAVTHGFLEVFGSHRGACRLR